MEFLAWRDTGLRLWEPWDLPRAEQELSVARFLRPGAPRGAPLGGGIEAQDDPI